MGGIINWNPNRGKLFVIGYSYERRGETKRDIWKTPARSEEEALQAAKTTLNAGYYPTFNARVVAVREY